jgi:hypothetical protein
MNAESGANANAVNQNSGGSLDVGLWQINSQNWGSCSGGGPPCQPNTNLNCGMLNLLVFQANTVCIAHAFNVYVGAAAIDVWKWGGNTFRLWSTCGGCGAC